MAYDIGTARGVVELDYNGRGIDQAKDDLKDIETHGTTAGAVMGKVARGSAIAGAAIAGGLALGVNAAANFEHRLSAIAAVSGATGKEMDAVRNKALQLGKDTQFSAGESAQAMEELIKAGLSVEDVLNGAADATVNLAAAGEVDMVTAATIASNAMNQFGLKAQDMVGVVDNIAGAANASAIDVNEFGMSLSQVGAVANLAGVSFEDTATAIALMGNAGIKGSDAGTSLKTMLNNLQPTTEKQIQLFKELGLVTKDGTNQFYDAQGNLKSMAEVSQILQGAVGGLTSQQRQMALETMFGSDAIRAAAVIAKEGGAGFRQMSKDMNKVSAADVAKKRMDNFKGSLEQLKGSLETAGIAIGTVLIPGLRKIADSITGAVNAFLQLSDSQQKYITIAAVAASATLMGIAALIKIVQFIQAYRAALVAIRVALVGKAAAENMSTVAALRAKTASIAAAIAEKARAAATLAIAAATKVAAAAQWAMNAAMAANPIGLIIIAIIALVAAFILLWKNSETFRNIVTGAWEAVKAAALAVYNWFMSTLWPGMKSMWAGIVAGFQALVNFFIGAWNWLKQIFTNGLNLIRNMWNSVWGTFGPLVRAIFNLIMAVLRLWWTVAKGLFIVGLNFIKNIWQTVWNGIKTYFSAVWSAIRSIVTTYINVVKSIISTAWNFIKGVTSSVWNAIKGVIQGVWNAIDGVVMGAVRGVQNAISNAWNAVRNLTTNAWNSVSEAVGNAVDRMMDIVSGIMGRVTGALSGAGSWLYSKGQEIIQGLIDGITSMIDNVAGAVGKVTDAAGKLLPGSPVKEGALKVLNRGYAGKQIVQMVIDGIEDMAPALGSALDTALGSGVSLAAPTTPLTQGRTRATRGKGSRGMRLVEGRLALDERGRAFITGLATDEDAADDDYEDTLERMG